MFNQSIDKEIYLNFVVAVIITVMMVKIMSLLV